MLRKISFLILIIILICSACEREDSIESLYRDAEKLESNILKSVNTISQCRANYEIILRDAPESEFAALACYKLGKLNEIFGHYDEAIEYYKNLLAQYPEHQICADGLLNMAQIYQLHLDKSEDAMATYQQLVAFYPDHAVSFEGYLQLGQLYSKEQDWEDALRYFQTIVNQYPDNDISDDLYFRMGDILQNELEDTSNAKKMYRTLIEKYPDSSWEKYVQQRLAELRR